MVFNEHLFEPSVGTSGAVCEAANAADLVGLCIIPPAEDGTKRPLPNARGRWGAFTTARPTGGHHLPHVRR